MRRDGWVLLWLGMANSKSKLDGYVEESYALKGTGISQLGKDFNIAYYDEDFREAVYRDLPTIVLEELIAGASYENIVAPRTLIMRAKYEQLPATNCQYISLEASNIDDSSVGGR